MKRLILAALLGLSALAWLAERRADAQTILINGIEYPTVATLTAGTNSFSGWLIVSGLTSTNPVFVGAATGGANAVTMTQLGSASNSLLDTVSNKFWNYVFISPSNVWTITTNSAARVITNSVEIAWAGGGSAVYSNWSFSTVSNAVLVSTTNGTTINVEINGTGSGSGSGPAGQQAITNAEPSFDNSAAATAWYTPSHWTMRLVMSNALTDHATNTLTVSDGEAGKAQTMNLVVRSNGTDSMGVKRYYIKWANCLCPGAQTLLGLGDGLSYTSHVFTVFWDGYTNRLVNAAYNQGL